MTHAHQSGYSAAAAVPPLPSDQVRSAASRAGSSKSAAVHWAVGVALDGQAEALGVWDEAISGSLDWSAVFDELALRGVEQIDAVIASLSDDALAAGTEAASITTASVLAQGSAPPLGASRRFRRALVHADLVAERAGAKLAGHVKKAPLGGQQVTQAFIEESLRRFERLALS